MGFCDELVEFDLFGLFGFWRFWNRGFLKWFFVLMFCEVVGLTVFFFALTEDSCSFLFFFLVVLSMCVKGTF